MACTPETRAGKWWYAYEAGGTSCVIANSGSDGGTSCGNKVYRWPMEEKKKVYLERALELDTWNVNCPIWGITATKNNKYNQKGRKHPPGTAR